MALDEGFSALSAFLYIGAVIDGLCAAIERLERLEPDSRFSTRRVALDGSFMELIFIVETGWRCADAGSSSKVGSGKRLSF